MAQVPAMPHELHKVGVEKGLGGPKLPLQLPLHQHLVVLHILGVDLGLWMMVCGGRSLPGSGQLGCIVQSPAIADDVSARKNVLLIRHFRVCLVLSGT